MELSNLRFVEGRAGEAEDYLRRARELLPSEPATLHEAAEALRREGRLEEAMAWYREALRVGPEFAAAHVGISAALIDGGRHEEASESLAHAFSLDMDSATAATAHYLEGLALLGQERPTEAARQFERVVEQDPHHFQALDRLAHWLFGEREYEEALDLYRSQAALEPDNPTVHANIGVTLHFLGRTEEALASMQRVLALDPDNESARSLVEELRAPPTQTVR